MAPLGLTLVQLRTERRLTALTYFVTFLIKQIQIISLQFHTTYEVAVKQCVQIRRMVTRTGRTGCGLAARNLCYSVMLVFEACASHTSALMTGWGWGQNVSLKLLCART